MLQIYEKWSILEVTRKSLDINKIVIRGVPILTPPRMFILLYFIKLRVTLTQKAKGAVWRDLIRKIAASLLFLFP